ncbi:MAG: RNA polymerase sigma factor [Actinomycetota bacterium]|nr:sigma-70 family RNA polymerase sigma factor [Actinomycetota bacterium]
MTDREEVNEEEVVAALRAGDEAAFVKLVEMFNGTMLRVAMGFVSSRAVAEEVVQEAWLGVLKGLQAFEGRSSLKTWIFRILTNIAKTRGQREGRSVPFSSLDPREDEPVVDPSRFHPPDHPQWPNAWAAPPRSWSDVPEDALLSKETRTAVEKAIKSTPPSQRIVITLRDVDGWSSEEVCNALHITETNQRVLLHRARSRVRAALERYLDGERVP